MFERYTESARRCLFFSRYEASMLGSRSIEPEHILLGMIRDSSGVLGRIFSIPPCSPEALRRQLEAAMERQAKLSTSVEIPFSLPAHRVLQYTAREADDLKHNDISPEHMLLGLLREEGTTAASILTALGLTVPDVRAAIVEHRTHPAAERRTDPWSLAIDKIKAAVDAMAAHELSPDERLQRARNIQDALDRLRDM